MPFNQSNPNLTPTPSVLFIIIISQPRWIPYCSPSVVTLNIMYDLHNVINLSVDMSHVLVLSYYYVENIICLKQKFLLE